MKTTIIAISVVLATILLLSFTGKENKDEKDGKVTVKIITEKDGKTIVIDTTFTFKGEFDEKLISNLLKEKGIDEKDINQKIIKTILVNSDNKEEKQVKIVCLKDGPTLDKCIVSCNINLDSITNCCKLQLDSLHEHIEMCLNKELLKFEKDELKKNLCVIKAQLDDELKELTEKEIRVEVNEDGETKQIMINGVEVDPGNENTEIKIIKNKDGKKVIIISANCEENEGKKTEKNNSKSTSSKSKLKIKDLNFNPNPSDGNFKLSFTLPESGNTTITILDGNGKEVYSEKLPEFTGDYSKNINISSEAKGLYVLKIQQGDKLTDAKIVIK